VGIEKPPLDVAGLRITLFSKSAILDSSGGILMQRYLASPPWLLGLLLAGCLGVTGCGQSKGRVSGKVYQSNGQPLPGGRVWFFPSEGGNPISALIQEDGHYEARDVPIGLAKVTVETEFLNPNAPSSLFFEKMPQMTGLPPQGLPPKGVAIGPPKEALGMMQQQLGTTQLASERPQGKYVKIDSKYSHPETSGLTYTVQAGDQQWDIHLK
jgi:hypothetical protein